MGHGQQLGFFQTTPPRPDKSSCWKSTSFLSQLTSYFTGYLASHASFSNVPGATSAWGTTFMATTWVTLKPLTMVIREAVRFFTMTATHLLLVVIIGMGIHDTQAVRQAGSITLLQGSASSHACCYPKIWSLFWNVWPWMKKHQFLPSLSFWQPCSSQSDPWFGLQLFHSWQRGLLNDMPTSGIFLTHS